MKFPIAVLSFSTLTLSLPAFAGEKDALREPASSTNEMKVSKEPLKLPNSTNGTTLVVPGALKFSAFTDLRYTVFSSGDPAVINANAESGFGLEDGAFAISYDQDNVSLTADIAVRRLKDSDFLRISNSPNQSNTNRINFGAEGSQFYIKYRVNPQLAFDLGQFDSIFGVEATDARNRAFSKAAVLSIIMLPLVHTGFMAEYAASGFTAKAFASNPNGRGTKGTSATGDESTEYGFAAGYSDEHIQTQLGYMTRAVGLADGKGRGQRNLYDISIGLTLGNWTVGLDGSDIADPSKNTLTPLDANDGEADARGGLALVSYRFNEKDLLGLRFERIDHDAAAVSVDQITAWGVSFHHRIHSNLDLATEFIDYQFRNVSGTTWSNTLFNVGAIVSF